MTEMQPAGPSRAELMATIGLVAIQSAAIKRDGRDAVLPVLR